eukprot:6174444-Ditylum_brightwellii.AAC.1
MIAADMLMQVELKGFTTTMIEGIMDHDRNETTAVHMKDKYVKTYSNQKDKSESWVYLEDMKELHLIKVAEYARAQGIADEPTFVWWVPYMLRKCDIIIFAVRVRIRKTTDMYGIKIPTSLPHAHQIDAKNGNNF